MNKLLFLFLILFIALIIPSLFMKEGFYSGNDILETIGEYPKSIQENNLTFYPSTNKTEISNNSASNIWWHYPIFQVGSYKQITNNLKYPNNPDEGTCMPAEFCGSLYENNQVKSNYIEILQPVPFCENSVRINYYNSEPNMRAFNNEFNILY